MGWHAVIRRNRLKSLERLVERNKAARDKHDEEVRARARAKLDKIETQKDQPHE